MGFRLVPRLVTLNDLKRRNGRVVCVISPNSVAFGAYYVKVIGYYTDTFCEANVTQRI